LCGLAVNCSEAAAREHNGSRSYGPQERVVTVPRGCSEVIVPLDVIVGCTGTPSLPICIAIVIVQSYRVRPGPPGPSNRTPPVIRVVAVKLDSAPPAVLTNVFVPSMKIAGSPLIVTDWIRHSVNSIRDDEVNVSDAKGPVCVNVSDLPGNHGRRVHQALAHEGGNHGIRRGAALGCRRY
jgi:hypothetical protein